MELIILIQHSQSVKFTSKFLFWFPSLDLLYLAQGLKSGQLLMKITFYFRISAGYSAQLSSNLIFKRRLQNQPPTNNISKQVLQNVMAVLHAFCKVTFQMSLWQENNVVCDDRFFLLMLTQLQVIYLDLILIW